VPFGGGVRRCLGASFAALEMREVLRAVAARFTLRPDRPLGERMRRRSITLAPARGGTVIPDALA
jgi:cytochrome P450 family 135